MLLTKSSERSSKTFQHFPVHRIIDMNLQKKSILETVAKFFGLTTCGIVDGATCRRSDLGDAPSVLVVW